MINTVSQAFMAKLNNGEIPKLRMQFVPAEGDAFWMSDGDFWSDGTSFTEATSNSGEFSVGAAIIGAFNFTLNNFEGNLTDETFRGALVVPLLYFEIEGSPEYLAKGVYYIATHNTVGNLIRCTAYDGMKLLDEHQTAITYPITVQNLIATICTANSITLATPTIPNGSFSIATKPEEAMTDRQMLSYACQITGNFAKMDENGYMYVGWYDTSSSVIINNTFDGKDLWTNSITITGVKATVTDSSGETVVERTATYGTDECMVSLKNNPCITANNMQSVVNTVGQRICGITFRPGTLPILSNPCIQAGDVLLVTDNITGNTYNLLATEITYSKQVVENVVCNFESEAENDIRPTIESKTNTSIEQAKLQSAQAANLATAAQASAAQAAIAAAIADDKAEQATASAIEAAGAAYTAELKAQAATESAQVADQKATDAQNSANAANESAMNANISANSALVQLSVVEDVVDVLSWVSNHATYKASTDTEVVPGKYYFTRSGSGTSSDPYTYNVVSTPTGDPSVNNYYELDSIDEAVSNYVSTHLALDNAGLWVIKDSHGYKILLANDGLKVYDAAGNLVSTFGENITLSSLRSQYIGGENAYIVFNAQDGSINIGGSRVTIGGSKTLTQMLDDIAAAVTNVEVQYAAGTSPTEAPESGWSASTPIWQEGQYIWQRTATTKNGTTAYSNTACIQGAAGSDGQDGEDATLLKIDSSRGVLFKSNNFSTVLTVTIYKGGKRITNASAMHAEYGAGAYLQWYWRKFDDSDWRTMLVSDSHITDDGFTLTITPDDVDEKIVFKCDLIV